MFEVVERFELKSCDLAPPKIALSLLPHLSNPEPMIKMQKFLSKDLFGKDFNSILTDLLGQLLMIFASRMNDGSKF